MTMEIPALPLPQTPLGERISPADAAPRGGDEMMDLAKRFESVFVAEMLKHAGFGEMRESFNGGAGEAAFSGMLTSEYAAEITETGAIGIADQVYRALQERIQG